MSARDELRKYVHLLADWWTPRETTDNRVEWLYGQVEAEVLREAAEKIRRERHKEHDHISCVPCFIYGHAADLIDPDKEESADGAEAGR